MAGLLDDWINQQPMSGGLLNVDDVKRAQQMGLFGGLGRVAEALMIAGQPSRTPGGGFGSALAAFPGGYAQAQGDAANSAMKQKVMGQQFQQNEMQMQQAKDKQAAQARLARYFSPPTMGQGVQVADASGTIGAAPQPAKFDLASVMQQPGAYEDFIKAGYDPVALQAAMQKGPKTTVLKPGEVAYDENTGQKRFEVPAAPKPPEYKDFVEGGKTVTYQISADGTRTKVSEGPRWQPDSGGGMPKLSPAQKAIDEAFGKDYAEIVVGGGAADIGKNLSQLKGVIGKLKTETGLTGPGVGMLPDQARSALAPQSMAAQEAVEEVVQRNLRLVLGAQFTEKEGERLIRRSYNPSLGQAENVKRLERLSGAIEKAYRSKMEAARYFEANGTLAGYKGTTRWKMSDFESALDGGESEKGGQRLKFNPQTGELE